MEVDALVWARDDEEVWVRGRIVDKKVVGPHEAVFTVQLLDSGETRTVSVTLPANGDAAGVVTDLPDLHLVNAHLAAATDEVAAAVRQNDIISLTHLHEAAILHVLSMRFSADVIYSFTGRILLAVNPFTPLPLYADDHIRQYEDAALSRAPVAAGQPSGDVQHEGGPRSASGLPPHVFDMAASAYRQMMSPLPVTALDPAVEGQAWAPTKNQSILVSGESGAGKTETTKHIMKFLASVGRSDRMPGGADSPAPGGGDPLPMDKKVMVSNPILEAYGNAKTLRNDNSSRFGKFIELRFQHNGKLLGGRVHTYLLEKVRVVSQASGERNYHAFYQLCNGATEAMRKMWCVGRPDEYHYLNQSGCTSLSRVNDREEFHKMARSMIALGFTHAEMQGTCRTLAAILHLGNVKFVGDDKSTVDASALRSLKVAAKLLHLDRHKLMSVMCTRRLDVAGSVVYKDLAPERAAGARDALAKLIYGCMFDWIVMRTNEFLGEDRKGDAFVGILDVFGFETFAVNSFEQLCINYTNESLQQQFNQYVFKLEQEVYRTEGISWTDVDFPDNGACVELIEGRRPPGVLAFLDQECLMPRGSDPSFARKLYDALGKHPCFDASRADVARSRFAVRHYAGRVVYDTAGFCDKNKDAVNEEARALIAGSEDPVISAYFHVPSSATGPGGAGASAGAASAGAGGRGAASRSKKMSVTVAGHFRAQLRSLVDVIRSTTPHFVRCLKPNSECRPRLLNRPSLVSQLRSGGVLEAARVSRLGYPIRMPHDDFLKRYRPLLPPATRRAAGGGTAAQAACAAVLAGLSDFPAHAAQSGRTRVFIRNNGFTLLEARLAAAAARAAVDVQRVWRGHLGRLLAQAQLCIIVKLQSVLRVGLARAEARRRRVARSAVRVQAVARGAAARRRFAACMTGFTRLQAVARGAAARRTAAQLRAAAAARRICAARLTQLARRQFLRQRAAARSMQRAVRAYRFRTRLARARRRAAEAAAAVHMQRCARGFLGRRTAAAARTAAARTAAAVAIQSAARRRLAAKAVRRLRTAAARAAAAQQLAFRAARCALHAALRHLRAHAAEWRAAATVQRVARGAAARRVAAAAAVARAHTRAAVVVQCAVRRHAAQSELRRRRAVVAAAARVVQCAYRCYVARCDRRRRYLASARYGAALRVQATYRGHVARAEARRLRAHRAAAASVVQVAYRRRFMRAALHKLCRTAHASAAVIQRGWRCAVARATLKALRRAHAAALVEEAATAAAHANDLEAELAATKRRLAALQAKHTEVQTRAGGLEADVFGLRNEVRRLKATLAVRDEQLTAMDKVESDNRRLREQRVTLRSVLCSAREALVELPKLQATVAEVTGERDTLRAALDSADTRLLDMVRLEVENGALREECDALCKRLADATAALARSDTLRRENDDLRQVADEAWALVEQQQQTQTGGDVVDGNGGGGGGGGGDGGGGDGGGGGGDGGGGGVLEPYPVSPTVAAVLAAARSAKQLTSPPASPRATDHADARPQPQAPALQLPPSAASGAAATTPPASPTLPSASLPPPLPPAQTAATAAVSPPVATALVPSSSSSPATSVTYSADGHGGGSKASVAGGRRESSVFEGTDLGGDPGQPEWLCRHEHELQQLHGMHAALSQQPPPPFGTSPSLPASTAHPLPASAATALVLASASASSVSASEAGRAHHTHTAATAHSVSGGGQGRGRHVATPKSVPGRRAMPVHHHQQHQQHQQHQHQQLVRPRQQHRHAMVSPAMRAAGVQPVLVHIPTGTVHHLVSYGTVTLTPTRGDRLHHHDTPRSAVPTPSARPSAAGARRTQSPRRRRRQRTVGSVSPRRRAAAVASASRSRSALKPRSPRSVRPAWVV